MTLSAFLADVRRTVLPNGLTLITRPHARGGVVAINTWVKAGYFHEPDEVAGMAHLFEHMFFKGSKMFPGSEEIAQHVSMLGGSTNAGTIYDSTNYYFVLPKEGFIRGVEIQADAIANPLFDIEELRKESEVVIEESNRKLDNPPALATERMYALAFQKHRMKRWRIGSNEVLRNIRRENLVSFFETLYRPSNIILTIAGDVNHEEAIEVVQRTFGAIPAGSPEKNRGPAEEPQEEFRFGEGFGDIKQSFSVFGWHTPGEDHPDEEALEILASILGSGRYSRFYRNVVGPGSANSVSASNSVFEDVGIFTIRASMADVHTATVERRIMEEIERMKHLGPSAFELQLARNRIESGFVFQLEEVLGQAQTLAFFESRGGYERMTSYLEKVESLTADSISEVARRYLRPANMTLYRYRPTGSEPSSRAQVEEALLEAARESGHEPVEPIPLSETQEQLRSASAGSALQRFVLRNGMTLFVKEVAGTPTVSASVFFRGGRLFENSSNAGITQLMGRTMRRGTSMRSGEQIDREIEFLGTQLGIVIDEDYFGFKLDIIQKHLPAGLGILADVICNPVFPDEGLAEEKHLQLASIQRSYDSSSDRPFQLFSSAYYGNHPYGLPETGFASSVDPILAEDLRGWYRETIVADDALLVVVGDVRSDDVHALMESSLGSIGPRPGRRPLVPPVMIPQARLEVIEHRDRKQSAVVVGFPTVPPKHPDWIVLRLIQDITSGLAGTFFAELRARRSLAYTVFAGDSSRDLAGTFVGYIASDASKEFEAKEGLIAEIHRLGTDGIKPEDLERARSYATGSMRIRLQTNSSLASEITQNYLFGLGLDFTDRFLERIRTLTLDEVRDVAKKYLSRDNYTVATLRGKG